VSGAALDLPVLLLVVTLLDEKGTSTLRGSEARHMSMPTVDFGL